MTSLSFYHFVRIFVWLIFLDHSTAYLFPSSRRSHCGSYVPLYAAGKGFGGGFGNSNSGTTSSGKKGKKQKNVSKRNPKKMKKNLFNNPKSTENVVDSLLAASSTTKIGEAVASSFQGGDDGTEELDPFWELMPSLIHSRFTNVPDHEFERIAGFLRHAVNPKLPLEEEIITNEWRPHEEIHAYMPGLGPTKPFHDPQQLQLCRELENNYETITKEYEALINDINNGGKDRFQSVTSMNYDSGWKTLVLFYNGHRIPDFPYDLCPVTTKILESVPLAGRIAGFNRQKPGTGIPLHSDGNNMWLTCQMGIKVPEGEKAFIRVGPETRHWKTGECLLYDTTYEHETMNEHPTQERVVLHVDFFNTLAMTPIEIETMQYIYTLREEFMKAEGVDKVGAQIL